MRKQTFCAFMLASLLILGTWGISNADVRIENDGSNFKIRIFNTISKADANSMAKRAGDFDYGLMSVMLSSSLGGDANAAMKIGEIVRRHNGSVLVTEDAKCYSSCALIYIAGVSRFNLGVIGLHRPYFAGAPSSRQEIERQVPLMLQQLKSYVQQMGLTDNFYQEMVNTDPSNMALYRGDQIKIGARQRSDI